MITAALRLGHHEVVILFHLHHLGSQPVLEASPISPCERPNTDNMAYTDDPWAVSDNEEDVAMVGGTLDIVDELSLIHI